MTRVNYREAARRFMHIDADFVGCKFGFPEHESYYTVRFYPTWEHPLYVHARAQGAGWGFSVPEEAYRNVTVYPIGVHAFFMSPVAEVVDWDFTQAHPMLWQYENASQILCNDPLSLMQWMDIADRLLKRLEGRVAFDELSKYASLEAIHRWGANGSFVLGTFPRTLCLALTEMLDQQGISYWGGCCSEHDVTPVLFRADGNYIIADDFEIDVPEFIHKPEWFTPR